MYQKLFQKSGYYQPTFFHAKIHTNENLGDISNLQEDTKSTFLHEYIHFIQDVSTYYGLMNIHINVDILKYYNDLILNSDSDTIDLPLSIDPKDPVGINIDLNSYYLGEVTNIKSVDKIKSVNTVQDSLVGEFPDLEHFVVKLLDSSGSEHNYVFGAAAIIESMAYEIEHYYFPDEKLSDAPYKFVRKLIDFYELDLLDTKFIVALCDISLGYMHPAKFMISILQKLKDEELQLNSAYDLYAILHDYTFRHPDENDAFSFIDIFNKQLSNSNKQLKDYFTIEYFQPLRDWIQDIFENSRTIRNSQFSILVYLLDNCNVVEFIDYFYSRLGCPLLSNNEDKFWFHNLNHESNNQIPALKVINEIHELFRFGNPICGLNQFCKTNYPVDITDENCIKSPWERANYRELCYFGQVFKMWGLGKKSYRINH